MSATCVFQGKPSRSAANVFRFGAVFSLAVLLGGCGQKQEPTDNPCEGVTCGNEGSCAVVDGTAPVCLCKAGFFAEGLECKAIVAGAECNGVTCNGLGVCLVIAGSPNTPRCECNADAVSGGATTCLARVVPDAGMCTSVVRAFERSPPVGLSRPSLGARALATPAASMASELQPASRWLAIQ